MTQLSNHDPYTSREERSALLKDGTSVRIRKATADDVESLYKFFQSQSEASRRKRFFQSETPNKDLITSLCTADENNRGLTLLVVRGKHETERILGTGSYIIEETEAAEIAFSVDDDYQGKGIGTLLLERLALQAVQKGIKTFRAVTKTNNDRMISVFKNSGFTTSTSRNKDDVTIRLSVQPDQKSLKQFDLRDRVATIASLKPFFEPESVAVIGASRNPDSIGFRILKALIDNNFQGPVYPINPNADVIRSIHTYSSVSELPEPVDLGVVVVPAEIVPNVVEDCAGAGVKSLVVISAGFAETGDTGKKRQQDVLEHVRRSGMRMIGPNCLGLLNAHPDISLNASFSPVFPGFGPVAMLSQSGALGLAILQLARDRDLGLSSFVSVGNKADVSGNDLIQYWEEDEDTDVILLYLESFGNPRKFARISRRVSRRKPIIAVKGGKTSAGERAASSHTAALAGNQAGTNALFKQTGVLRADDLEEMFDLAAALSHQPLPDGRRIGIVTNSGGPGILCTDACETNNLEVPEFDEQTKNRLQKFLPEEASVLNPVDMVASAGPDSYKNAIKAVLNSSSVDALIILYIPVSEGQSEPIISAIKQGITEAKENTDRSKPVIMCQVADERQKRFLNVRDEKVPSYLFPETPALVLSDMADYAEWLEKPRGQIPEYENTDFDQIRDYAKSLSDQYQDSWLPAHETRNLLHQARFPLAEGGLATSQAEATEIAQEIGYPVAIKLVSQQITHKSDVGGVELHLQSDRDVQTAFERIRTRVSDMGEEYAMEGVLVQEMEQEGTEIMIGVQSDPQYGHLIGFGLGGIFVEVLSDVTFRIAPLSDQDAEEMINEIKGSKILHGYRGKQAVDVEALKDLLLRVSSLVYHAPQIQEMDLNPVFAKPEGEDCSIVDVRIRM